MPPKRFLTPLLAARFWSKVDVLLENEVCWAWKGSRNVNGYGTFRVGGFTLNAHRVAYSLFAGDFPASKEEVRHTCDNPCCVNPSHLTLGTHADNMRDMRDRGRVKNARMAGEENPRSQLSEADVKDIKRRIAEGETNISIAQDYPVSNGMISRIRTGVSWGHLD